MFHKLLFAIGPPHEAQVDPHRLLNARFANMHGERIRQVGRPIFPRRKRWYLVLRGSRAKTKAKRRGFALPTRPSLPKQSAPRTFALSFFCIANPTGQARHLQGRLERYTRRNDPTQSPCQEFSFAQPAGSTSRKPPKRTGSGRLFTNPSVALLSTSL